MGSPRPKRASSPLKPSSSRKATGEPQARAETGPSVRRTSSRGRQAGGRGLVELAKAIGASAPLDALVTGITLDSRRVRPGDLFVAIRGTRADGREFAAEACARGAVAAVAEEAIPELPTVVVPDPRAAAASLAAALNRHPAERLRLIGVSGTLGKTSTAFLLRDLLATTGEVPGVIGSLGVHFGERSAAATSMTTPDAPILQETLRTMADNGLRSAIMEVTSHALAQHRVDGLSFKLGVLTNLVPDEHLEFHPTPEDYLRTKIRFFDLLAPGAPLVVDFDDACARSHVEGLARPVIGVSRATQAGADITIEDLCIGREGSFFSLRVGRALPGLDGRILSPTELPLALPVVGVQQVTNLTLAATAALLAGAEPEAIVRRAAEMHPIRRRMEVVRGEAPMVLDDTVGNPRSLRAVFETVRLLHVPGRLRIVFGIRGGRGPIINEKLGRTLAELVRSQPALLVVTACEGVAGPRDRVQPEERTRFLSALSACQGFAFEYEPILDRALARALHDVDREDLVLLLGAQGMDPAARIALAMLERRDPGRDPIELRQEGKLTTKG